MSIRNLRSAGPIIVLGIISAGVVVFLKWQSAPVPQRPIPPVPSIDYTLLIKNFADQASRRNVNAVKSFEFDINRIFNEHELKLRDAASAASKEAADYTSCTLIVYYLAWDKVKHGNLTVEYLDTQIKPITEPAIKALAHDINFEVGKLDSDLKRSILLLAKDYAAAGPSESDTRKDIDTNNLHYDEFEQSLRNLGFSATAVGAALVFDAFAIFQIKTAGLIWNKIISIAQRIFAKQVAKVAASGAVAAADGPLPVGDILAIGGLIWTGYDIYAGRKKFESELYTSLNNALGESNASIHKQAAEHASRMLKSYQDTQDSIGTQTVTRLSGVQK